VSIEIIFGQIEVGQRLHGEELDEYPKTCLNDTCFGLFDQMEQMGSH
jgi:hypothetical protein